MAGWRRIEAARSPAHLADEGAIYRALVAAGVPVEPAVLDPVFLRMYGDAPEYDTYHRGRYWSVLAEKQLEHFLSIVYLDLKPDDVLIDIGSAKSPFPDIARRLAGCTVYRQDLLYETGVHGDRIGGDAVRLPLPDGSVTKLVLHCAFEHFAGDSDSGFIREAARVLAPGGRLCILPLYLATEYVIFTQPTFPWQEMPPDPEAVLWFTSGGTGEHHVRFYDVAALQRRVLQSCDPFRVRVLYLENARAAAESCYLRFILLLEKR